MEQLNRAKRYLKRIESQYVGVFSSMGHDEEEYFDDVLSFFIHCYHVRDWMLHEQSTSITARAVDAFINEHPELRICADLANGSKHCKLTRTTRTGHLPTISDREANYSTWYVGNGGGEVVQSSYRVNHDGEGRDVLELARECIALWEGYWREAISHAATAASENSV